MRELAAIQKIRRDLAYRLPTSRRPLAYVVLRRDRAEELLKEIERLRRMIASKE